jgi:predicted metalloprotease with PDZ domain
MFHAWNPARLGTPQNEELYWFTEGFTDYYTSLLLLRAGLISPQDYLIGHNELIKAYLTSAARALPAKQVTLERLTSYEVERVPYQRGSLLASNWTPPY